MTTSAKGQLFSSSTELALNWAWAAARHRRASGTGGAGTNGPNQSEPTIGPADLLVGTLLSHPDKDGEARVLLHHFALTARDVLPWATRSCRSRISAARPQALIRATLTRWMGKPSQCWRRPRRWPAAG